MPQVWNGQQVVNTPDQVEVYTPPPNPFAHDLPKVTNESVAAALKSGPVILPQSWTGIQTPPFSDDNPNF